MFEYLYKFRNCGSRVGYRDKIRPVPTVAESAAKSAAAFIRASQIISAAEKPPGCLGGGFSATPQKISRRKPGFFHSFLRRIVRICIRVQEQQGTIGTIVY